MDHTIIIYSTYSCVAIAKERFTYKVISESGYYAVNIMNFRYVSNVADAGRLPGYRVKNKFRAIGLTPIDAHKIPVKVVKEADAVLECRVRNEIEVGDHNFIIGDVVYAYATEDFNLRWGLEDYLPILYISDGFFMTINKDTIKRYVIE